MAMPSRKPYGRSELRRLLEPRSIAVVGASDRPGSLGLRALGNLSGFAGAVFPVSPRLGEIGGRRCYRSVAELPDAPDCVVLALPADAVEPALRECAAAGAGAAVVFASGFAETGGERAAAAQARIAAIARETGMRIVGPNTTGLANLTIGAHVGFAEFPHHHVERPGAIGLVSQSGAMGLALSQAGERGASISHVLTAGNSCDVDVADFVSYLAEVPQAGATALVFEGLEDAGRLADAAGRAAAAGQAVVAFKLARSQPGRLAAASHTATDAGMPESFDALFREAGIVPVSDIEHLVETASFFSRLRHLPRRAARTPRVAVLSASGGTGILAADIAHALGLDMPQPQGDTLAALRAAIPAFGAARNPCDATAQATSNPDSLRRCAEAFLSDPAYDALVMPSGRAGLSPHFAVLSEAGLRHGKPVCVVWMSQWLEGPGAREAEALPGLSLFRSMRSCLSALAAWGRRS